MQLRAIDGVGEKTCFTQYLGVFSLVRVGGDGQAQEQRYRRAAVIRWIAAAILDVATLAGVGVEQRAQAVTGIGAGGRGYPGIAEEAVTHTEIQPPGHRQVALRQGEGVVIGLLDRAFATAIRGFLNGVGRCQKQGAQQQAGKEWSEA